MRKLFGAVLTVVALAGTIAAQRPVALAQDEQPVRGGRLELVALNDLATLDNSQALDLDYNMVAGALYEGLYHFDPRGRAGARPRGRPARGLRGRPRLHLPPSSPAPCSPVPTSSRARSPRPTWPTA